MHWAPHRPQKAPPGSEPVSPQELSGHPPSSLLLKGGGGAERCPSVRLALGEPAGMFLFLVEDLGTGSSVEDSHSGEAPSSVEGVLGLQTCLQEWFARKGSGN